MADSPEISASRAASYRPAALVSTAVFAAFCGALVLYDPRYTQLAIYALYAIPAHLLISFLPHEPALWIAARLYPAIVVAVVGTSATLVAIVLDYWLIGWLVNHHLVKPVVQESRWFTFASRWFRKAPALLIAGSALAPVPFYPVKIMAIAADYPLRRFIARSSSAGCRGSTSWPACSRRAGRLRGAEEFDADVHRARASPRSARGGSGRRTSRSPPENKKAGRCSRPASTSQNS